jgi:hypothetical protein
VIRLVLGVSTRPDFVFPAGQVKTVAGYYGVSGTQNGFGTNAAFTNARALVIDGSGSVFISMDSEIRKLNSSGLFNLDKHHQLCLFRNILSNSAQYVSISGFVSTVYSSAPNSMWSLAISNEELIYATEYHLVSSITTNGVRTVITGSSTSGSVDGALTSASFNSPYGIVYSYGSTLYVSDANNQLIRKIQGILCYSKGCCSR